MAAPLCKCGSLPSPVIFLLVLEMWGGWPEWWIWEKLLGRLCSGLSLVTEHRYPPLLPKSVSVRGAPAPGRRCGPLTMTSVNVTVLVSGPTWPTKPALNLASGGNKENLIFCLWPFLIFVYWKPFGDGRQGLLVSCSIACFLTLLSLSVLIFKLRFG